MATATATDFSSIPDNKGCSGYDYEFIDGEPRDQLKCSICHLVLRDPHQVTCCSNRFCKSCLDQLQGKNCPLCREPINDNYFRDGGINREIISLKVYCTNSEEGCEWQGTINETGTSIDTHLNSCPYQLVPCTNGCGEKIKRSLLKTHLTDNCTKRMVNCQYCNRRSTHQLITSRNHLLECPDLPIQCSNEGCNEKIPRHSLASHNEACPKAIIPCEYNTVGCNKKMKREEQESHNKESMEVHLQLTDGRLQMTKEKLQEATETIKSLKTTLEQKNQLTASLVFKISQFTNKKEEDEKWYSPGFYTSPGGYKMSLSVYPNEDGDDGKTTYISCYISLMAGEYDDILEWPFQGEVTIELLNQLEDRNHKKGVIRFDDSTPDDCKERVGEGLSSNSWGRPKFISHKELDQHNSFSHFQYLKDDSLYLRVSVKVTSRAKSWLNCKN
ncbi:PREDICTED: TNF receptor-associated factor 5-like isoform X1 [Amphimedon queenslandica]|uniref:RING-type E3 ubiquitin transferase n=2 Tax=Amphimedon queenslandica TaxID=400682 RepID=A0AAN0IKK3_AMPQE|nr:PREDICTED: TNF receptor-associated factor 5-like isoform X1 [Amphimedon queenslandica]|eukprot:XP_011403162.2 PREDICTED: TNF receptor-associated factor 5-like isoform X1 [Amphimedon queenslandica]